MYIGVFGQRFPPLKSFVALVTLEWLLPSVNHHVLLQVTNLSTCKVALVTLVGLFTCMVPHHMNFQINGLGTGVLACCAHIRLFSRMGQFMLLYSTFPTFLNSHWLQINRFSPVCLKMCFLRILDVDVLNSHWLQIKGFSPVCL